MALSNSIRFHLNFINFYSKLYMSAQNSIMINPLDVTDFCYRCMTKVDAKPSHAKALADVLMAADYSGHFSHGLNRIEMYVNDIQSGTTSKNNEPTVIKDNLSTALVDGNNCLGPVVGNFCMQLAIEKAKKTGVGWVSAKGSNHYGIAGWYSQLACNEGLIGMSFTNTSPLSYPTRAKKVALGTNPLTLAAPAADKKDDFWLDMATTTAALGKIEMKRRKNEEMPLGWAADKDGNVTTNAEDGYNGGLLPVGGSEETGGYKGYGMSMMVEIFCGIMSGSFFGSQIRSWGTSGSIANLGQGFVAIDPSSFDPNFKDRMSEFAQMMRGLPPVKPDLPVLIPGDKEREHRNMVDSTSGIPYPKVLIDSMDKLASRLQIEKIKTNNA